MLNFLLLQNGPWDIESENQITDRVRILQIETGMSILTAHGSGMGYEVRSDKRDTNKHSLSWVPLGSIMLSLELFQG